MASRYELPGEDWDQIQRLRDVLRVRRKRLGVFGHQLGKQLGLSTDFIYRMENGAHASPRVSYLQRWALGLGVTLQLSVDGWDDVDWSGADYAADAVSWEALYRVSGDSRYHRLWLVAALRAWRIHAQVSPRDVGLALGKDAESVTRWEVDAHDPLIARAMAQARASGSAVRMWVDDKAPESADNSFGGLS